MRIMLTLECLPTELITEIHSYLSYADLKAVRLVSKAVSAPASRELFRVILVKVNMTSFRSLSEISKHEELSNYVRTVRYSGKMLPNHGDLDDDPDNPHFDFWVDDFERWLEGGVGHGISADLADQFDQDQLEFYHWNYSCYCRGQYRILAGDNHVRRLTNAFKSFKNLAGVSYERNRYNKAIEGPITLAKLSSVGQHTLMEPDSESGVPYQAQQFFALLKAVRANESINLKSLRGTGLEINSFNAYPGGTALLDALTSLSRLTLHFSRAHFVDGDGRKIARLIGRAPLLESLQLSFEFSTFETTEDVIKLEELLDKGSHWKALKTLKLQAMATDPEILTQLLHRHAPTLRSLELGHIDLRPLGGYNAAPAESWVTIIQFLQENLKLDHVRFHGNFSNRQNEGWVTYDEATKHSRLLRSTPAASMVRYKQDCLRYRIEQYITRGGVSPFTARSPPGMDYPLDDEYHGLNWIYEEDESWSFEERLL